MNQQHRERISQQCDHRGILLAEAQLELLTDYLELLLRWRQHLNLTGLHDPEQMIEILLIESLDFLYRPWLPEGARVLDLGSGAGVPGIPLAISAPDLYVTLLDRSEKKVTFLRRVVALLRLEHCEPCSGTAAEFARRLRPEERFDVVVSRGVGSVAHLMQLAAPLLPAGGRLLLRKPAHTPEMQEATPLLATAAWGEFQTVSVLHSGAPPWALLSITRGAAGIC